MGRPYIANYDVVAKAVNSNEFTKQPQHMLRKWVAEPRMTQDSQSSTQKLVKELLSSGASTSMVSNFFVIREFDSQ